MNGALPARAPALDAVAGGRDTGCARVRRAAPPVGAAPVSADRSMPSCGYTAGAGGALAECAVCLHSAPACHANPLPLCMLVDHTWCVRARMLHVMHTVHARANVHSSPCMPKMCVCLSWQALCFVFTSGDCVRAFVRSCFRSVLVHYSLLVCACVQSCGRAFVRACECAGIQLSIGMCACGYLHVYVRACVRACPPPSGLLPFPASPSPSPSPPPSTPDIPATPSPPSGGWFFYGPDADVFLT